MKETIRAIRTLPARGRRLAGALAESAAVRMIAACLGELGLGFVLAGAGAMGQALPFAVCLAAASGTALRSLSAMLGGALGYLYFWGFTGGLEYLAVGVLVFAAVCIVGGSEAAGVSWFMPALTAGMSMLVGLLFLLQARFAPLAVAWYLLRLALAAVTVWAFASALDRRTPGCRLYLLACAVSGLSAAVAGGGVTLGQVAAIAVGCAAVGTPHALLIAAACGLAVDVPALPPVSLTALLCFASLACLCTGFRRRAARMLVYLTALVAGVLFTGGQMPELVIAAALGCCLSLLIPQAWLTAHGGDGVLPARRRLELAASVFGDIHAALEGEARGKDGASASAIFDRASDQVCGPCPRWELCWEQKSTETYRALCAVARPMLERGAVVREDFPQSFSESCCRLDELCQAIDRELDGLASRRQYRSRLRESRAVVAAQYGALSGYLRKAAESLDDSGEAAEAYAPELGVGGAGKPGNTISGDRGACFRAGGGRYYLLLCDGMGTGPEAAAESAAAIRLLSGLLRAGEEPRDALETLNGVYLLRGDGGFSTVDLLAVSLVTGDAVLYKWGGAPSYLKSGGEVQKIGTAAPPPGLGVGETHKAEEYRLSLREGELLVLLSDGAGGEEAGKRLASWEDGTPRALAAALIEQARTDGEDDMTAAALRLRPCPALV